LGDADRGLGSARHAGPDRGFRPALVGEDRDQRRRFIEWLEIAASKLYDWRGRYGKVNEHNGWVPRDFWLEEWESQAIIGFHLKDPLEGHRRLTFMMLDADIVAVSPSSARPIRNTFLFRSTAVRYCQAIRSSNASPPSINIVHGFC